MLVPDSVGEVVIRSHHGKLGAVQRVHVQIGFCEYVGAQGKEPVGAGPVVQGDVGSDLRGGRHIVLLDLLYLVVAECIRDITAGGIFLIDRMACPIGQRHIGYDGLRTVVDCLGHHRSRGVDVFTRTEGSLHGKTFEERHRNLEAHLKTRVTLVDSGHREVCERVVRVIIETHQVALVHDFGPECRCPDLVAVAAVLVVEVRRDGLDVGQTVHQGVAGPRRKEGLVELRSIQEEACIGVDPVSAGEVIFKTGLDRTHNESRDVGLAL